MTETIGKPVAFEAEYITYRHMKTSGTIKIELEIPGEKFAEMNDVIGQPPKVGTSKWVYVTLAAGPDAAT